MGNIFIGTHTVAVAKEDIKEFTDIVGWLQKCLGEIDDEHTKELQKGGTLDYDTEPH